MKTNILRTKRKLVNEVSTIEANEEINEYIKEISVDAETYSNSETPAVAEGI